MGRRAKISRDKLNRSLLNREKERDAELARNAEKKERV